MVKGNKISSMIENPYRMHKGESIYISNILEKFPYFQTAHILFSKALQNTKSIRFKSQLKKAAIYTGDRNLLYDIISQQEDSNILKNKTITARLRKLTIRPFHNAPSGTKKYRIIELNNINHSKKDVSFLE